MVAAISAPLLRLIFWDLLNIVVRPEVYAGDWKALDPPATTAKATSAVPNFILFVNSETKTAFLLVNRMDQF